MSPPGILETVEAVPFGYCHCRCGLLAPIAKMTNSRYGHVKGQPVRFCAGHNVRFQPRPDLTERYWPQVDKNGPTVRPELGPCWIWTGASSDGYEHIWVNGRSQRATHVTLELAGHIVPEEPLRYP
jgi:hypothetical protein